jgi:sensor histidine kinase YesM
MKLRSTAYWGCQVLGWGAWTAFGMTIAASQRALRPGVVIGFALFFGYSIALTHLLRREIRRRQWMTLPARQLIPRMALTAVLTGAVLTGLVSGLGWILARGALEISGPADLLLMIGNMTFATSIWITLYVAISGMRRYREASRNALRLQLALREAELRALAAQVNPHFLFNCLNTIRGMIVENPAQAQDMITQLANILRYNLQQDRSHTVPLERELEIVSDYLALESARFEERLRVEFAIDPAAVRCAVPSMLLQTLVENALKHGFAKLASGGDLVIRAAFEGGALKLRVENPGHLGEPAAGATQVGLKNARERLRLLYGDGASLELANGEGGRVTATVLIPRTA